MTREQKLEMRCHLEYLTELVQQETAGLERHRERLAAQANALTTEFPVAAQEMRWRTEEVSGVFSAVDDAYEALRCALRRLDKVKVAA